MSSVEDVTAAAEALSAAQFAAGQADQRAADAVSISDLNARLVAAQAQEAALLEQVSGLGTKVHDLTPVTIRQLTDFAQQNAGLFLASGSLAGDYTDRTVYRLPAGTSTKKAPNSGTNQLKLIRAGGLSAAKAAKVDLSDFTVQGTPQPTPLYGGVVVQWGSGSTVSRVAIVAIPGNASGPPGETFSLAFFHSDVTSCTDVTIDGAGVAATLLGYNYTTGHHTIDRLKATGAISGFGLAMFQAAGSYLFTDCDLSGSRKAINLEQTTGDTYDFVRCDFRGTKAPYVAQASSLTKSAVITFVDPIVDAWPLQVRTYPSLAGNKQRDSDIRLIRNGVDVSADPTQLVVTHSDTGSVRPGPTL